MYERKRYPERTCLSRHSPSASRLFHRENFRRLPHRHRSKIINANAKSQVLAPLSSQPGREKQIEHDKFSILASCFSFSPGIIAIPVSSLKIVLKKFYITPYSCRHFFSYLFSFIFTYVVISFQIFFLLSLHPRRRCFITAVSL